MIKSPEYAKTNQEMFNYIQSYVQAFEDAVDLMISMQPLTAKEYIIVICLIWIPWLIFG